jgi:hypothetical protein
MQKAIISGERQGGVTEAADPVAKENWVVIKIHTAPMCTEGAKSGCATVGSPSSVLDALSIIPLYPH